VYLGCSYFELKEAVSTEAAFLYRSLIWRESTDPGFLQHQNYGTLWHTRQSTTDWQERQAAVAAHRENTQPVGVVQGLSQLRYFIIFVTAWINEQQIWCILVWFDILVRQRE